MQSYQPGLSRAVAERNRVVIEQLPQVQFIAQRIHSRLPHHVPLEDLINTGVLGLIEALGKFDRRRKVALKSYASHRIRGAILDSLREQDWGPRLLRQKGRKLEEVQQELIRKLGRAPSRQEIAERMSLSEEGLSNLLCDLRGLCISSLQSDSKPDGQDLSEMLPARADETPFELCRRAEINSIVKRAVKRLSSRQQRILHLYYFDALPMKEIGVRLGVCESRISQMHTAALQSLRCRLRQFLARGYPPNQNDALPSQNARQNTLKSSTMPDNQEI
jgi:RNA polymerase sigma factor FliA